MFRHMIGFLLATSCLCPPLCLLKAPIQSHFQKPKVSLPQTVAAGLEALENVTVNSQRGRRLGYLEWAISVSRSTFCGAKESLSEALKVSSPGSLRAFTLGKVEQELGDRKKAREHFNKFSG